jgi:hypothetical protein
MSCLRTLGPACALAAALAITAAPAAAQHTQHTPESRVGRLSEEVVVARLNAAGFTEVQNLRLEDAVYRADAVRNGQRIRVEVDAVSGRILSN